MIAAVDVPQPTSVLAEAKAAIQGPKSSRLTASTPRGPGGMRAFAQGWPAPKSRSLWDFFRLPDDACLRVVGTLQHCLAPAPRRRTWPYPAL